MADEDSTAPTATTENGTVQTQGDAQAAQADGQQPAQPAARANGWSMVKGFAIRMLIIYLISSFFRRGQTPAPQDGAQGPVATPGANTFSKGMDMDMYVYVNDEEQFTQFDSPDVLFWKERGLIYGDWEGGPNRDGEHVKYGQIIASEDLKNNGSIFIHVYFVKAGYSPNPKDPKYKKDKTAFRSKMLNKFKKRRFHTTVNLLTGQTDAHPDLIKRDNSTGFEILSHWHPNLTLNLLDDHSPWTKGAVPAPLDEYIDFLPTAPGKPAKYLPVVFFNDYWNMNSEYMPINDTTKELNLTLTFSPISLFRWQLYAAQGMRSKWYGMMGADFMEESDEDQDSLKTTFLETNPYLLGLTIVVSIVHSVFEFLAFKNDIQFWKGRKSLEGLSVRSVFFNVFQSLIVVLYVLDNETNTVVRISVMIGLAIEVWKIFKVIDVKVDRENKLFGILPKISYQDKSTYTQSKTKQYDMMAFKYLSWLLFPLLGGYAIYSLFYMEHRGWYSWVLSMLYGFLLTFGFIMMTPQLFINYKLKSVAHLPWRMMTYKALNTFIDDIFAFVIKMPTLYRIGCFRDDVVFFIFLYQRWIYRVDPTRVNEFGVSQEMLEQNGQTPSGEGTPAVEGSPAVEGAPEDSSAVPKTEEEKKKD